MKSIKRIKEKISNYEDKANEFLNPLQNKIQEYIHGNKELNTIKHINYIKDIIKNYKSKNFIITDVKFYEGYYFSNDKKEINSESAYNDWSFLIVLKYEGICNCEVILEVLGGYVGFNNNINTVYYFKPYKNKIEIKEVNNLKNKLNLLLRQLFIRSMIDLAFKDKIYLNYSDDYNNYEIWDKKPSSYGESIAGGYHDKCTEKMIVHIKNLIKSSSIREYAENKMDGEEQEIKWIEYKL